jgi:hypothetical protein
MTEYLFKVQERNRLSQKGLLRRFSVSCYGQQPTKESILSEKAEKFKELKGKDGTKEYEAWFLKYVPKMNKAKLSISEGKNKKSKKADLTDTKTKTKRLTMKSKSTKSKTRKMFKILNI